MKQAVREALAAAGVSGTQLAALEAKYPARRRVEINTQTCPACGVKPNRNDYACLACSEVKAGSERRFWQYAVDLAGGQTGRPKNQRPKKQVLPPQVETVVKHVIVPIPEDLAPIHEPEMYEFLVHMRGSKLVVVTHYRHEAIRMAREALRLPETTGHSLVLRLMQTAKPMSKITDFWTDEENAAAEEADVKKGE